MMVRDATNSRTQFKLRQAPLVLFACLLCWGSSAPADDEITPAQADFFEAKIRPVLIERCYDCHSEAADTSEGGLYVDSQQGLRIGGSGGAAVVPGKPDDSVLLKAITYQHEELQMPPEEAGGKLSDDVIDDFRTWISMGAPDPRTTERVPPAHDLETAANHWAFQPIRKPALPWIRDEVLPKRNASTRAQSSLGQPVDALVTSGLADRGLRLNSPAERRVRLRRLAQNLTGLPPSYEDVEAFLNDPGEDAWGHAVERFLNSPTYGEHWARYWMDVARYADTRGYLAGGLQERYAFSHTYRDYLIQAFNDDKPYDRFVLEQLAADQLDLGKDQHALAAMGFLTLGRRFINNTHLIIDDRIDVVTRGLLGLTVSCARCHDHKFDPIPTADYYSLHGVFASSREPKELPLLDQEPSGEAYEQFLEAARKIEAKIERIREREIDKFLAKQRQKTGDYLLAAMEVDQRGEGKSYEDFAGERGVDARLLRRWQEFLAKPENRKLNWLRPWYDGVVKLAGESSSEDKSKDEPIAECDFKLEDRKHAEDELIGTLFAAAPETFNDLVTTYNEVSKRSLEEGGDGEAPNASHEAFREFLEQSPSSPARDEVGSWIRRHVQNLTGGLRRDIEALNWTHEGAPVRAHVLLDRSNPGDSRILKRGNPGSPGDTIPRQYLTVLAGPDRKPFQQGSGRLELAQEIASSENPLTARVFVNRVWGWHFGKPLVDTPSDFGVRTAVPEQLDLLNWLAADFMEHGWSVKHLHRRIVHSRTFQQSSTVRTEALEADPDNRLWHHFPRRRLHFEALRDTLLAVSGELDLKQGGLPVDITKADAQPRRTVYAFIERQNLPGLFRTFDFPSPDATVPARFVTTVPQQGLFMLNSSFAAARSRAVAKRVADEADDAARIRELYRILFQRDPSPREERLGLVFVSSADSDAGKADALGSWELYAQTLLFSNELAFIY